MVRLDWMPLLLVAASAATMIGCAKEESDKQTARVEQAEQTDLVEHRPAADPELSPSTIPSQPMPPESMPVEAVPLDPLPQADPPVAELQPSFAPRALQKRAAPDASAMRPAPYKSAPSLAPAEAQPSSAESMPAEMSAPSEAIRLEAPPEMAAAPENPPEQQTAYDVVQVYYATDRAAYVDRLTVLDQSQRGWLVILLSAACSMALAAGALLWKAKRMPLGLAAIAAALAAGGVYCFHETTPGFAQPEILLGDAQRIVGYGGERGQLHLGVCEVSIPPNHEVGRLEAPSILRFEFQENPEKHVVLTSIQRRDEAEYFEQLRETIAASEGREALVFVHGFNVSFDDAVRRTAQIAYDLRFEGAPICYSWPSQAQTLAYTVDENNVVWTVPHLKQFLLDVIERTGAESINLVAHSMGNRALTSAVRELTLELRTETPLFNEIVLAAPDIDADVFQRDIAPAMIRAGRRVTLYASSNDQALAASRAVHGYPRAGESGARLVVVPGIDTIDVSAIDTSLLGHNYYGDSSTLLYDMHSVIRLSLPPDRRNLLQPMSLQSGLRFWVFQAPYAPLARPASENMNR